ncbi:hypothetical protein HDU92_000774, partial [Lobulomyces angularis]
MRRFATLNEQITTSISTPTKTILKNNSNKKNDIKVGIILKRDNLILKKPSNFERSYFALR